MTSFDLPDPVLCQHSLVEISGFYEINKAVTDVKVGYDERGQFAVVEYYESEDNYNNAKELTGRDFHVKIMQLYPDGDRVKHVRMDTIARCTKVYAHINHQTSVVVVLATFRENKG